MNELLRTNFVPLIWCERFLFSLHEFFFFCDIHLKNVWYTIQLERSFIGLMRGVFYLLNTNRMHEDSALSEVWLVLRSQHESMCGLTIRCSNTPVNSWLSIVLVYPRTGGLPLSNLTVIRTINLYCHCWYTSSTALGAIAAQELGKALH